MAKSLLRFITCGSVDDGKSTLIGRLLYDCRALAADQIETLKAESRGREGLDFSLLVDGLAAEREQGITIDVAYRYFQTDQRKFIVADTPGHEQYTRNMVTGASTADLAVILVDARKGVLTQTRRHSHIAQLLGLRHVVVAVNKMDLVGYSEAVFTEIVAEYQAFAANMGFTTLQFIPLSGLTGENVVHRGTGAAWYEGKSLLETLEAVEISGESLEKPFRMPVQWVNRNGQDFRGFTGQVAQGRLSAGDEVMVQPSGVRAAIKEIVGQKTAIAGDSVCVTLDREVDCSRGDLLVAADRPMQVTDQFEARVVWMGEEEMLPGRPYLLKCGAQQVTVRLGPPKYELNVNTGERLAAKTLSLNAIGVVTLAADQKLAYAPFDENPRLGSFILIDRETHATVAGGMIRFGLRRAQNLHWQKIEVSRDAHALQKGQKPKLVWMTGLSGAGKSTIANLVEKRLFALGKHSYLLDGDNVRHGLNRDLGFTDADRVENIRRVAEVGKLMVDAGLIVLSAFISPFAAERRMVREMMGSDEFLEVFIDTPLAVAEGRDVKGLYSKARAGELRNFTGIDSPYEAPTTPDLWIDTTDLTAEEAAEVIVERILQ